MTHAQPSNECPYCECSMSPTEMTCVSCSVSVKADFEMTSLGRLPSEHQRFIEMFVLASGSLKEIASHAGVSYPTVRNRLDKVISAVRDAMAEQAAAEATKKQTRSSRSKDAPNTPDPTAAEIIKRIT